MGYSLGGGTALRTAIQHPALVRKLVLVSTVFARDGWYPEVAAAMQQMGPSRPKRSREALPARPKRALRRGPRIGPSCSAKFGRREIPDGSP